jgi:hypothetical protein
MRTEELATCTRTVVHLAGYFGELKAAVRRLQQQIAPSARGYFTPEEEDAVRGVLVSYWQARAALLEVITAFRVDADLIGEERPLAFVTAFAAALLLVDAARFLRETVGHRPVVCAKLNQPAPEFGIPADVYDTIQWSLVRARHAWHLYHAVQYYDQHRRELQALGEHPDVAPLLAVIEQLHHRLDLSIAEFARAKLRTRARQLLAHLARDTFGQALYGLQKLCGLLLSEKYVRYGHQPALPPAIVAQLQELLRPGDVVAVRKEYALTNYFLPGYWPHVALYLGDTSSLEQLGVSADPSAVPRWRQRLEGWEPDARHVLEALKDGVRVRALASPCASDSIVVLRTQLRPDEVRQGLLRGLAHEGKAYDFDFDFRRSDRLVCTEVVYRAYDGLGGIRFPLVHRAGRPTLSGSDLIALARRRCHLRPVGVYAPAFVPDLVVEEHAVNELLDTACGA